MIDNELLTQHVHYHICINKEPLPTYNTNAIQHNLGTTTTIKKIRARCILILSTTTV